MYSKHLFCLSGCGYLQDIIHTHVDKHDKVIAKIKVITDYDMSNLQRDDVYVDCEVSSKNHLVRLNRLLDLSRVGNEVLVGFKAGYSSFAEAISCLDPVDPNRIVMLQAKLQSLGDCYINGQLEESISSHLRAVA